MAATKKLPYGTPGYLPGEQPVEPGREYRIEPIGQPGGTLGAGWPLILLLVLLYLTTSRTKLIP